MELSDLSKALCRGLLVSALFGIFVLVYCLALRAGGSHIPWPEIAQTITFAFALGLLSSALAGAELWAEGKRRTLFHDLLLGAGLALGALGITLGAAVIATQIFTYSSPFALWGFELLIARVQAEPVLGAYMTAIAAPFALTGFARLRRWPTMVIPPFVLVSALVVTTVCSQVLIQLPAQFFWDEHWLFGCAGLFLLFGPCLPLLPALADRLALALTGFLNLNPEPLSEAS